MKNVAKKSIPVQKEKITINQKEKLKYIKLSQNIKIKSDKQNIQEEISKYGKQNIPEKEIKNTNQQLKTSIPKKNISNLNNISKPQLEMLKKENQVSKIKSLKKITSQAIIIGALSSHLAGKVSKEIIESLKYNKNEKENLSPNTSFDLEEQNLKVKKEQVIQRETTDNNIHPINQEKIEEKNEENSKQEAKQDLEPFYIQVEEIKLAHDIIQEDLLQQELEIEKLKEKLKSVSEQEGKKIKLNAIKNTSFKLVNFFNPFHHFFKNTFISRLIHSILINHKVKKMRRIIEKENMVKYYNVKKILKEISDKKDIIQKNILININTLEEINVLRNDLLKENSNLLEVIEILEDLKKIEKEILEKNRKLQEDLEKTKQLEEKGKIKIKEFKNVA